MKTYINRLCLIVIATFLSFSCNDDFLDRQPLDEISNESFWNTENDLLVYNNSLYDLARNDNDVPILMAFDDGFDHLAIVVLCDEQDFEETVFTLALIGTFARFWQHRFLQQFPRRRKQ